MRVINKQWKLAVVMLLLLTGFMVFGSVQPVLAHSAPKKDIIISGYQAYWNITRRETSGDWGGWPAYNYYQLSNNDSGRGRYYFTMPGGPQNEHRVTGRFRAIKPSIYGSRNVHVEIFVQEANYGWEWAGSCTISSSSTFQTCSYFTERADGVRGLVVRTNGTLFVNRLTMTVD